MAGFTNSAISFPATIKVGTFIVDGNEITFIVAGNEIARLPAVLQRLKKESNPSQNRHRCSVCYNIVDAGMYLYNILNRQRNATPSLTLDSKLTTEYFLYIFTARKSNQSVILT